MTFTLAPYQARTVNEVLAEVRDAQRVFGERAKMTAVGLTAPTGAGKTVIATAVLERLLFGDEAAPENRDLAVLWVTDDPALNRQTSDKMLLASARLSHNDIVFMDSRFDQKRLGRGKIHFVHIQQLGKGARSFHRHNADGTPRDTREYGFWDTIANTVEADGANFLLVIDEAHRGTEGKIRDAATIVERLSHGGPNPITAGHHPAAPIILGITATPDRWRESMDRKGRALTTVAADVAEVRASGLLKDRIIVRHPGENQPANQTLLALAVGALRRSERAWAKQHDVAIADGAASARVEPLLVIQVAPGTKEADLAPLMATLEAEDPSLVGDAVAHAFQQHTTVKVPGGGNGERDLRYLAPDRIAADPRARVVFFKNALTTGWDCPRAEVMLSLRSASDYTSIAQLIGRMVRTPLGERVEDSRLDERTLNSVTLYLPHYDRKQVAKVIEALDAETRAGDDIEIEPIDCVPRDDVPEQVWDLLGDLPSAARVKRQYPSQTHRLLALARLLRGHDLVEDANDQARARLVGAVKTEAAVHARAIKTAVEDVTTLDMASTVWDARQGEFVEDDEDRVPRRVQARVGDVRSQFKAAQRVLPDAVAKWYWNALLDEDPELDPYEAEAQVAALVKTEELATTVKAAVEKAATDQITAWRSQFANRVSMLGEAARLDFENVWSPRVGVLTVDLVVPDVISAATEKVNGTGEQATVKPVVTYGGHLYVARGEEKVPDGRFPTTLTGWEQDVLKKESDTATLVGWYRNPPRSKHGLAIPYGEGDSLGLLYPDFLFFHEVGGSYVVDIVDPHLHTNSDTGPKWAGLAEYAREHRERGTGRVRRAVAVIKVGADLLALNLTRDKVIDRLKACKSQQDIEDLFADMGGTY